MTPNEALDTVRQFLDGYPGLEPQDRVRRAIETLDAYLLAVAWTLQPHPGALLNETHVRAAKRDAFAEGVAAAGDTSRITNPYESQ